MRYCAHATTGAEACERSTHALAGPSSALELAVFGLRRLHAYIPDGEHGQTYVATRRRRVSHNDGRSGIQPTRARR